MVAEAMEPLGQLRFDLVLSDLQMLRMGGLALAQQILSASLSRVLLLGHCLLQLLTRGPPLLLGDSRSHQVHKNNVFFLS